MVVTVEVLVVCIIIISAVCCPWRRCVFWIFRVAWRGTVAFSSLRNRPSLLLFHDHSTTIPRPFHDQSTTIPRKFVVMASARPLFRQRNSMVVPRYIPCICTIILCCVVLYLPCSVPYGTVSLPEAMPSKFTPRIVPYPLTWRTSLLFVCEWVGNWWRLRLIKFTIRKTALRKPQWSAWNVICQVISAIALALSHLLRATCQAETAPFLKKWSIFVEEMTTWWKINTIPSFVRHKLRKRF